MTEDKRIKKECVVDKDISLQSLYKRDNGVCYICGRLCDWNDYIVRDGTVIDNDALPEYNPEQPYKGKFSGKRIYRGLYQSANGTKINADVNGAANILRKANRFDSSILCQGFLANPQRIRLA